MKKLAGYIWIAAVISALIAAGYLLRISLENEPEKEVIVRTDTLVIRDTIREIKPVYVTKLRTEYDTVVLSKIVRLTDTVKAVIPVYYEKAHYEDADIWYHGYDAAVDSIQVFPETKYITLETTITKTAPKWGFGWSLGPSVGIDYRGRPTAGVSVSFGLQRRCGKAGQ